MKKLLLAVMLLSGCAHISWWEPTEKAKLRRLAEMHLRHCMFETNCKLTKFCIQESVQWCVEHEMERTCGTDGIFTAPIMCPKAMLPSELSELHEFLGK